jgi:1-acyl-sn-glycerol-3-phosphate acyltransferase
MNTGNGRKAGVRIGKREEEKTGREEYIPVASRTRYFTEEQSHQYFKWRRRLLILLRTQRIEKRGYSNIPAEGVALLVSNHMNWKDIFLIGLTIKRQVHFLGTYELFDPRICRSYYYNYFIETIGPWAKVPLWFLSRFLARVTASRIPRFGVIPVDRSKKNTYAIDAAKQAVRKGRLICVFPEGGTGTRYRLKPFKKGMFWMIRELFDEGIRRIPVIPVGLKATDGIFIPWRRLSIYAGEPIFMDDYMLPDRQETVERFTAFTRKQVAELAGINVSKPEWKYPSR